MNHRTAQSARLTWPAFAIGLALSGAALSALAADDEFVKHAAMGGLAEVAAGALAQKQGSSDAVKQFGAKMVADHTQANDELKQVADGKKMTVPAAPDPMHREALAALEKKSGGAFDKAFKAQMVKDHKATVALFQKEAKGGSDSELKAFAAKTLPDLKHHLEMAQAL